MVHDEGSARPAALSLRFLSRFAEPILQGRKTQTLRRRTRLRVGQVAVALAAGQPFARLRVTHLERVRLAELGPADLLREGGSPRSVDALLRALRSLYGADLTHVYRIRFSVESRKRIRS